MNIHGYAYYEMPGEIRYRYPAPGSCDQAKIDHPNLFKRHWKTPFRDSHLNIRPKEKRLTWNEDAEHYISKIPALDPNDPFDAELLKE